MTAGGFLLVLSLVVPVAGVLLAFVAGGRHVERIALATMLLGLVIAGAIALAMTRTGNGLVYLLGGWSPPLGVGSARTGCRGHDGHHGGRDLRRRRVRAREFRIPRVGRGAGAVRVLICCSRFPAP